ncbi:MAG: hypothetical protein OXF99_01935 [bacterium]|nr:hypothetical protein [bacterium]
MARSGQKVEEREALEVLCGWGVVAAFEWLEAGKKKGVRTPDLRLELTTGQKVLTEVRMHTYSASHHLFSADGKEFPSRYLKCRWEVRINDPAASEPAAETSELFKALVDETIIPLLVDAESAGGTAEAMGTRAKQLLRNAQVVFDSGRPRSLRRRISVWRTPEPVSSGPGLVKTWAGTSYALCLEGVDHLVEAVQDCIDQKDSHGQGAAWLVAALDGSRASQQLEEVCNSVLDGDGARYSDINTRVDMKGFDEVWAFARSFNGNHHMALRMTRTSAEWKRLDRVRRSAARTAAIDIEALTESSGTGPTIHGDFLYAEEIGNSGRSR